MSLINSWSQLKTIWHKRRGSWSRKKRQSQLDENEIAYFSNFYHTHTKIVNQITETSWVQRQSNRGVHAGIHALCWQDSLWSLWLAMGKMATEATPTGAGGAWFLAVTLPCLWSCQYPLVYAFSAQTKLSRKESVIYIFFNFFSLKPDC